MLGNHLIAALVGSALAFGQAAVDPTPAAAQAQSCLSPAGPEARTAMETGQVVPLSRFLDAIRAQAQGEVTGSCLTTSGGRYLYLVYVLTRSGTVKTLTVDAGTGTIQGGY